MTQEFWRVAQALVCSARGRHDEAELLAREAVEFALGSDSPLRRGNALATLAEVLENAGLRDEAAAVLRETLVEYESKPIIPLARRVRERLRVLEEMPA